MPEIITIFTDASLWGNKAGWAAWAKYRGETLRMSDGITFPVENISDAETIAITAALLRSLEAMRIPTHSIALIQSDSTDALGALLWAAWNVGDNSRVRIAKNTDVTPRMPLKVHGIRANFAERAFQAIRDRGLVVYLKHVRAHTGKDDPRSSVNRWCDKEAKRQMRSVVHQSAS